MNNKKFFAPLMGAVVLGLSAYAGYRTYDAYNGVSESDLLLANAEALANPDEGGSSESWDCYSSVDEGLGVWVCGNPCTWEEHRSGTGNTDKCYKNN